MTEGVHLDLDGDSGRALELDGVLAAVAERAVTAAGAALLLALQPRVAAEAIEREQALVEEARRRLDREGRLLGGALPDPAPALAALAVEDLRVEASALRDLASVLATAADLRHTLSALDGGDLPHLAALGPPIPDLRREVDPVLRHVAPDGRILDEASPELRRIRHALGRVGERLRRMLESYLHDPGAAGMIRDDFVTQRNGRFVVPVRADAPRAARGIVHGTSSSGATLFLEPLESVELNNELVRLAEEELEEQDRVVRGWADALRRRIAEVTAAVDAVATVDAIQARALFAASLGAVRPSLAADGPLLLRELRHPLLDRRLRERGEASVPVTIEIRVDQHVLVLSGPNAGGKTVALKAVGLAVLMAQCGLPVVASHARIPVVRQLRADIGDHQSIDADLSTFSAHVQAVARVLRGARPPCLFLFDEIGTGTEPTEGGAIARAVLERLVQPGMTTIATTHLAALKTWALATPGVGSAAMEFDAERMRPTFRVLLGAAGVSAGLDIAARMGLEDSVLVRARELLGPEATEAEASLQRLRQLTSEAEATRDRVARERQALEAERQRLVSRAAADAQEREREATAALGEAVRELREQARRELATIQDKKERARLERDQVRAEMRLQAEARRRTARIAAPAGPAPVPAPPPELREGVRVHVRSLEREGEVVDVRGDRVVVRMGAATFTVRKADLAPAPEEPGPASPAPRAGAGATVRRLVQQREARSGLDDVGAEERPRELLLLGKTVDEALEQVDRFLDASARAGLPEVRVVHGHGTGRLRTAVRRFLRDHPHVAGSRPGAPHEGGDGATVVTLH